MADKEVVLTVDGLNKLEAELEELKTQRRLEVAERLKQAIDFGDISENSEYDDAKNEQQFIEGRIKTIVDLLRNAKVIDGSDDSDVVSLAGTVMLEDIETGDVEQYMIVGSAEADPKLNKISNESPVGRTVLGQSIGSIVDVVVPAGVVQYKIVDIIR